MKAAVYHDTADIRIETAPDPALAPGELILEVHAAGICGTDVTEYLRGPIQYPIHARNPVTGHLGPLIPGHEVAGRIVAIGQRGRHPGHGGAPKRLREDAHRPLCERLAREGQLNGRPCRWGGGLPVRLREINGTFGPLHEPSRAP